MGKGAAKRQIVGVPGLFIILGRVGRRAITLTHVDKTVVQLPETVLQACCERSTVPWNIGNLTAVGDFLQFLIGTPGEIAGLLMGVSHSQLQQPLLMYFRNGRSRQVDTFNLRLSQVCHHPTVHAVSFGNCNNLIGDSV
ncbi:hypothetical protein SDC9_200681 [bioreactor metagenome]|uniref:Uncharacterized protein n=1 Tax=bioreactor metagenome TaxID=1076179 RepID=A0A645INV7_9ZZZZ